VGCGLILNRCRHGSGGSASELDFTAHSPGLNIGSTLVAPLFNILPFQVILSGGKLTNRG